MFATIRGSGRSRTLPRLFPALSCRMQSVRGLPSRSGAAVLLAATLLYTVTSDGTSQARELAHAGSAATPVNLHQAAAHSPAPRGGRPDQGTPQLTIADFSVVEVRTVATPDARTNAFLGPRRVGGGIVIDAAGLVLTAAYLVAETERIEIIGPDRQRIPATLVGHDPATGISLIRAVIPLPVKPISLGDSATASVNDPVLVVGYDGVAPAYIVSRREYAGSWEYLLDDALFTAPATTGWSGAALINREGKLLGVGMLLVPDAMRNSVPGNLFVPIDTLKPVIEQLLAHGKPTGASRPWLGIMVQDISGRLLVTHVASESPAEQAGIGVGDIIVGFQGKPLKDAADFYRQLWNSGKAGVKVELDVVQGAALHKVSITTMESASYLRQPRGF